MTGGLASFVRCFESLPADAPIADRPVNLGFEEAMSIPVTDPVVDALFAQSRAYGEQLEASLKRTDEMLARCECGSASVFCACDMQRRLDMISRWGLDESHFVAGPTNPTLKGN